MFSLCKICFAILFVAVGSVTNFKCLDINMSYGSCTCYKHLHRIFCKSNTSSIEIFISEQAQFMEVQCSNLTWSDLDVHQKEKYVITYITFDKCDLPKDSSLKTITNMLGAIGINQLHFHSGTNLIFKRLHLKDFEDLYFMDLSNNDISIMDADLLDNLSKLQTLDMRRSNIHRITKFFDYTPQMYEIHLEENFLQMIEPGTFNRLPNLIGLFLGGNELNELQSGIFDKLVNLAVLDINNNNLVSLSEDVFGKLKNLKELYLGNNNLTFFPDKLLRNNTNLQHINLESAFKNIKSLYYDIINLPNGFFSNLSKLKSLYLQDNGFDYLPEDLLWGCFSLTTLYLNQNYLEDLEEEIFRDLKELTFLTLDSNEIDELPAYVFANLTQLRTLDLSNNYLSSINDRIFHGLHNLENLDLSDNLLSTISDVAFTSLYNLKIADFSNNALTLYNIKSEYEYKSLNGIKSPFFPCYFLEELYLRNNRISQIFRDWVFDFSYLQILDLKMNVISNLSTVDLMFAAESVKVDLTLNKIQHIFLNYENILIDHSWLDHNLVVLIEDNPLHCDCALYNYLRYIEGKYHPVLKKYINIIPGNLTCASPKKFQNVRVTDLQSDNESFKCLAANAYVASMCPVECNCFRKEIEDVFIIDCILKDLVDVPRITREPLNIWQIRLNLSRNRLTQMPNLAKLGYGSVSELILSHNSIFKISSEGLPDTIEVLELHDNNISKISSDMLYFLSKINLIRLTLYDNPWICDCNIIDLLNFILRKEKIIVNLDNTTCYGSNISISKMILTDCPNN